jgi:hypothetical protein
MCGTLKIFSENLRLFLKIRFFFEEIFREIESFSKIARLSKYILSKIEAFSK